MDSRLIKPKGLPKPLLLKDYLLDDMSSCSSNGFKSFPRRQCCATTVRFLIEIDLKNKQRQKKFLDFNNNPPFLLKSPSKSALSAFKSVISAMKRLPFGGASSLEKNKPKLSILPRNLSKKILKKSSFWKRKSSHKEIKRWKSFDQFLKEDSPPLDISDSSVTTTTTTTSDGKSKSWSESDFTVSDECSSGNSSGDVNLNLPDVRNDAVEVAPENGDVSTTTSSDNSTTTNSSTMLKQWSVNEEKEQFSPVSVLDCPFDDDDEVSSPFQHMEGTKKQLMKKIQRFEYLSRLEPLNLTKRFATLPESDNKNSSTSIDEKAISDTEELEQEQEEKMENQATTKALDLLHQMKDTLPSYGLKVKADKLLLDFFTEKIMHSQRQSWGYSLEEELLEEAEIWINGRRSRNLFLEREVPRNREVYVKDMEKVGEWRSLDQENKEVALEFENVVFDAMLNELLLDIAS